MRQLLVIAAFFLSLSAASQAASLKIINQTDWQIDNVYISPSSSDRFVMYDYLGATGVIRPGTIRMVEWVARDICYWDFRVRFHARHNYATTYKNNLCVLHRPVWTITPSDIY
jgi:hypothetical protein